MKKILILAALIISLFGCETKNVTVQSTNVEIRGKEIRTYTIDSCEYIGYVLSTDHDILAHKGNCKYCAQRNKEQHDE